MLGSRVLAFIQEHRLVAEGDLLLVGVSGGADSLCLAHILVSIREILRIRLHVAHLDHALRPESQSDSRFVEGMAHSWGLPCTLAREDVDGFRVRNRLSLEEAARRVRYSFFARLSSELGASGVAVGHTADDQAETVLLHWIRGAGLAGLRGMRPATRLSLSGGDGKVTVVRPLLAVRRVETEEYCAKLGMEPRIDASNQSLCHVRNRIRHRLLPVLESYNPNLRESLLKMARVLDRDYVFLESEVLRVWPEVVSEEAGRLTLNTRAALALPPAVMFHLLRLAVEKVAGTIEGLEHKHLEEMAGALRRRAGAVLMLPRGLTMAVGYGRCTISAGPVSPPFPPIRQATALAVPGETTMPGWKVLASIEEPGRVLVGEDRWTALLDLDRMEGGLMVRAKTDGDRFRPLGMIREKRLQDFFVDAKVPRSWRDRVPLVVTRSQIAWVAGWRIDDRVKVTENTRRVLRLSFTLVPEASQPV
ncbi:MAG: tRNA lysidine(34) synthetase TilS [Dehalococcoidia bacterium]|nr:tRNA lysidine(34) synthetase TilS [Dehalococcoidia bacterium]